VPKSACDDFGFSHPMLRTRPLRKRRLVFAQLIMTVSLVLSIAVAATAVSLIGIARADARSPSAITLKR
jgi:hypothetical protein